MVSAGAAVGVAILIGVHTLIAAVTTRFLRLYADTPLGRTLAILLVVPLLLFLSTLVLSGALHLGFDLQDRWAAVLVAIGLPMAIGVTIDFIWVASPEAVEAELAD